jgi:hypothetical protein
MTTAAEERNGASDVTRARENPPSRKPAEHYCVRRVIKLSKVPWPHNVARHSFVSYHLAQFQAANKTALEAGHSEQMLFAHYRALVTPGAAAEFWSIVPG